MNIFPKIITSFILFAFVSCNQEAKKEEAHSQLPENHTVIVDTLKSAKNSVDEKNVYQNSEHVKSIEFKTYIPKGYSVLANTYGDLNLDAFIDLILVLKKDGEETSSDVIDHPEKRPLLILIAQPDNTFKVATKSNNAVYCYDCGGVMGDPFVDVICGGVLGGTFADVNIEKGFFSVEHYGGSNWRWSRTTTFKYSAANHNWYLYKDVHESFMSTEPDKTETKILTTKDFGEVAFDKFDIYKDVK